LEENIRKHVTDYNEKHGFGATDDELIETIRESKEIWRGNYSEHRWWQDCFIVVDIDGMKIGFWGAETTGDNSPEDTGWEFNPETICAVVEKTKTVTYYESC